AAVSTSSAFGPRCRVARSGSPDRSLCRMRFTPLAAVAVIVAASTCTPSDSGRVAAPRIAAAHDGDFAGAPDLIVDGKALEGSWVVYAQLLKDATCTPEGSGS